MMKSFFNASPVYELAKTWRYIRVYPHITQVYICDSIYSHP